MSSGYFPSPWPAEDAGAARLASPHDTPGLRIQPGEGLACTTRSTVLSTMTVLGESREVYLLTHSALRAHIGLPTTACVERIDPITLKTLDSSGRLPGGPMWPGGLAVHASGDLIAIYGRFAHRLNRDCEVLDRFELPVNAPYNSFVILDNGLVVTKNLSETLAAVLTTLTPDQLTRAAPDITCPEPSVARLSALGNTVYVVGVRSLFRYHWSEPLQRLVLDTGWRFDYIGTGSQTFGWDVVLDGQNAWFMDNGKHRYRVSMVGAGVSPTANRLIRVSLGNAADHALIDVCGKAGGSITNPPLVDLKRHIVVGFDSANRELRAWRVHAPNSNLTPLWQKSAFGCASHLILYPDTGELVVNDYRRHGEEIVVLQIENGQELGRVRPGGVTQGVVFPSVGWNRDFYWSSMGKLTRVFVQACATSR
ncbi:MAG: hypothetical protein CFE44_00325 [Burkholderiales bacterium PBB4]|nr:MAG: hypothetical protein CFE44_00325 [Burkholderiales bacterium PBB4]